MVNILASQLVIALNCFDFDFPVSDCEDRHIECATSEVENAQFSGTIIFLVNLASECNRSSSWLINNLKLNFLSEIGK